MKRLSIFSLAIVFLLVTAMAQGAADGDGSGKESRSGDSAIAERLRAPGRVCLEGDEECVPKRDRAERPETGEEAAEAEPAEEASDEVAAAQQQAEPEATPERRPAEEIYGQACAACHDSGAAGAPVKGEKGDWQGRFDKGTDHLVDSTMAGMGVMPPMGGCSACDETDIRNVVEYIMDETQ